MKTRAFSAAAHESPTDVQSRLIPFTQLIAINFFYVIIIAMKFFGSV